MLIAIISIERKGQAEEGVVSAPLFVKPQNKLVASFALNDVDLRNTQLQMVPAQPCKTTCGKVRHHESACVKKCTQKNKENKGKLL